ncbi:MAG: lysophospholipid acyltransferase family protein [Planctomycetota bacterium]
MIRLPDDHPLVAWAKRRQPGGSVRRVVWWHLMHALCFLWFWPCYRFRAFHSKRIPTTGPVLLLANHQSFLDPIIVGLPSSHRQFHAMARATLWNNRTVARLIDSLNAIPVDQEASDLKAIRSCVDVLKAGHALLVFPEGSRTPDGAVHGFEQGTALLIRRAKPTVVPVAIEGSFDAWPRGRKLPRPTGRIAVMYGEPVSADELLAMKPDAMLDELRGRVEDMRQELADTLRRHEPDRYPDTAAPRLLAPSA